MISKRFSWIFASLGVLWFVVAGISYFAIGEHLLFGKIKLRIEGFEKPLVISLVLFALAFFFGKGATFWVNESGEARIKKIVWIFTGAFVLWFFSINAVRESLLMIGYDMGTYCNILFNTAKGRWFLESHKYFNMLGEHFMLASALFAPAFLVWKSAKVLILFQSLFVSLSVLAIYRLALVRTQDAFIGLLFCVLFLISPYTHKIMMDPYRPITMAIPVFLWALVALEHRKRFWFWTLVVFSFTIQENTPIFLFGLGLYLLVFRPGERITGIALSVVSMLALYLVMGKAMPYFFGGHRLGIMDDFWKDYRGAGFGDILLNLIKNPFPLIKSVLRPDKVFQMVFFTSTVFFLWVLRPGTILLFLFPMLFYEMADFSYMNHFSRHYSSDPLVGVFFAAILAVGENKERLREWLRNKKGVAAIGILVPILVLVLLSQYPDYRFTTRLDFVKEGRSFLNEIPPDASVSCSKGEYYAQLAFREQITCFPSMRNPSYILVTKSEAAIFPEVLPGLEKTGVYRLVREGRYNLLYRKI